MNMNKSCKCVNETFDPHVLSPQNAKALESAFVNL
jgi:hypothetical protein